MEVSEKFLLGKILMRSLEEEVNKLDPADDHIPEIIYRAHKTRLKLKMFYKKWDEPQEVADQLNHLESIIKKLEQMQNKHVTDV
jgi:hypothetical protein